MVKAKKDTVEKEVENPAVLYARKLTVDVSKVKFTARSGAADRMFIDIIKGKTIVYFIEFKRPTGGIISQLQKVFYRDMKAKGVHVYLGVNDLDDAKAIISWHTRYLDRAPKTQKYALKV